MRPILFQIPVIPFAAWVLFLVGFFGLSAYWGYRDVVEVGGTDDERRKRVGSTLAVHGVLLVVGVVLLWRLRAFIQHPLPVRSYGFMLMLAFAAGMYLIQRRVRGTALRPEGVIDLTLGLLLVTLLSARLMFIALNWSQYSGDWREVFRVWEGGLSFHGGLLGGVGWVVYYARRHRLPIWWMGDMIAPSLALSYAIARIGCFTNGCCYGAPTKLPWGVRFVEQASVGGGTILTDPRHPTQLYAMVANLIIFAILVRMLPKRRYDGQIFGSYLLLYCVYRFIVEAFRKGATAQLWWLGMTQGQWASLGIAVLAVVLLAKLEQRGVLSNPKETDLEAAVSAAPRKTASGARAKSASAVPPKSASAASARPETTRVKAKGKSHKRQH